MNLFSLEYNNREAGKNNEAIKLSLPDSDITYYPNIFSSEESSEYFEILKTETKWQQDSIKVFGKTYPQPRLTALYGEKQYSYSGITMLPHSFTSTLFNIRTKIEEITFSKTNGIKFNVVLLNLYRNGTDSIGWHSDDEKELGVNPKIASVSFGAERFFHLKHKKDKTLHKKILLKSGSLLLMKGPTQHHYLHQIPKSKKIDQPRINLTFRIVN